MEKEGDSKVNVEIEQMLTALGDPTPESSNDSDGETDEEKAARETAEAENDKLSDEEKEAKKKEEEKAETARLAEEEARKNETEEQKQAREEAEAAAELEKAKEKEKEALTKIEQERQERETAEKAEEDKRKAEEEKKKKAEQPVSLEEQDFIGDLDLDDLVRDKASFNKLLNSVYSKGVNDSKRIATEGVLNSIPEIVKHNLTILTTLKEASDKFYDENKDLVPFKRVVAAVFEEIASKNPDKKYSELMELTAPEARKRLELHKQAAKKEKEGEKESGKPPRLPGVKSGQRQTPSQKPNTSSLEKEIEQMNSTLRR